MTAAAPFNMAAHVLATAPTCPDKVALGVLGPARASRWSYARLEGAVRGVATGLLRAGLEPGDRVLLRLGNTQDFPVAFLACLSVDLVPVPTSSQLTGTEVTALCTALAPAAVIAGEGIALPDHPAPVIPAAQLAAWHDLPPAEFAMGDPDRPGYVIYTSGTAGRPRGVVHAHRAILARQHMIQGWYGLTPEDRVLHAGAFNWTYTLGTGLLDPWTMGATALVPAPGTDSRALPLLLKRHDATIFAAAPGVYRQILRAPLAPMPKLRHGLSAGEKLPETIRTAWQDATGTQIHEAFGLSECSTFISGAPGTPAPPGTLGFPQPGRRIALIDAHGAEADHGSIAIHRTDPGLMLGYLGHPDETAARYCGDWFLTGDIGSRTTDGAIRYEGRADDMMNAGGYRVSPIEVETALAAHHGIDEAAAVEVSIKADTTVIAAFYTGPAALIEADLATFASERLARYKTPRLFIHRASLPRGANNKLLRRRLRQEWETTDGQA
ncbi:MAG: AMP-binding protein [Alphaproteobacteria bacterium]|jgi:acyl-coenzyme A synthetase/AMP-(fatty) acid ligase|nr:AMP-binding protein [Alphaproteobacteria bacterium]